ncbi:MAG: hypothetical protein AB4042_05760, partial [Leptolyngbyaceae cyanobacterium]
NAPTPPLPHSPTPPLPHSPTPPLQDSLLNLLSQCDDDNLRPVLIFDQFEEFFFAYPDPLARQDFFQFIADCLELPGALKSFCRCGRTICTIFWSHNNWCSRVNGPTVQWPDPS